MGAWSLLMIARGTDDLIGYAYADICSLNFVERHADRSCAGQEVGFSPHPCNVSEPPMTCIDGGSLIEPKLSIPTPNEQELIRKLGVCLAWAPASEASLSDMPRRDAILLRLMNIVTYCVHDLQIMDDGSASLQQIANCIEFICLGKLQGRPRGVLVAPVESGYSTVGGHIYVEDSITVRWPPGHPNGVPTVLVAVLMSAAVYVQT